MLSTPVFSVIHAEKGELFPYHQAAFVTQYSSMQFLSASKRPVLEQLHTSDRINELR